MTTPVDTVRKARGKSPLRAISPSRLIDILSSTPKTPNHGKKAQVDTPRPQVKMLNLDGISPSPATISTPTRQGKAQRLYDQLKQHLRAFSAQLAAVQTKMSDILNACGSGLENSTLGPQVGVIHRYAYINQEDNPHAAAMRAYVTYTERIRPLLLQASPAARKPYNSLTKELAAAMFLNGHNYKGILLLKDLLHIYGRDLDVECAYQKWCVLLNEWEALEGLYDKKNEIFTSGFIEHDQFANVCRQIHIFNTDPKLRQHAIRQLYKYLVDKKDEKTFGNYELLAMIHSCLSNAHKLNLSKPEAEEQEEVKSGTYHLEQMLHCSEVIVKNMARNLLPDPPQTYSMPVLGVEGKDANYILKISLRVAEYFYYIQQYVLEMFKAGQTRDACYFSLKAWIASLRLGTHQFVVRSTLLMFWIRFASFYDSHSRTNMRKMLQFLYSGMVDPPEDEIKNSKSGILADMTMGALTDTFMELCVNEDDSSVPRLHNFDQDCHCVNCEISKVDPIFCFEWHIYTFAYNGFSIADSAIIDECQFFKDMRLRSASDQQELLGTSAKPRPPYQMSMIWCTVAVQWLRHNDGIRAQRASETDIREIIEFTKRVASYAQAHMYVELLTLVQASRPLPPPLSFSWMGEKSRKKLPVFINKDDRKEKETLLREKALVAARRDYQAHYRLMYRDWRFPLCSMIAQISTDPWESAMMGAEMSLLATRQAAAALGVSFGEEFRCVDDFKTAAQALPEDFTVLQLLLTDNGDLVVVKLHCSRPPIIVPIASKAKVEVFLNEIASIMRDNDATGNLSKVTTDSKYFWKERRRVDDSLKAYCAKVQSELLGSFAMLFRPTVRLGKEGLKASKMVEELTHNSQNNRRLPKHIAEEIVSLFATGNHEEYESLWKPLVPAFCELVGRLGTAEAARVSRTNAEFYVQLKKASTDVLHNYPRYTLMAIAPELSMIPWENLPIFEKDPYVGRIASVHKLLRIFKTGTYSVPRSVDPTRGVYVCDPDNNLDETKKRMGDHMKKLGWNGITGKVPALEAFKEMLAKNDIFVFLGHGSGSKYFGRTAVRKSACQAVGFLMGCSSVAITSEGHGLDGRSALYDYFIADSPCVVGCLWMVTDGEIDRYFIDLSTYMFDANQRKVNPDGIEKLRMLMDGMAFARSRAKLRHLTGAAVVTYGIPVITATKNHTSS